jgi:hypothetical protein
MEGWIQVSFFLSIFVNIQQQKLGNGIETDAAALALASIISPPLGKEAFQYYTGSRTGSGVGFLSTPVLD